MDYNKVIINGRITKDPEARATSNGTSIVRFTLAAEDYSGKADFFDCKAWRETAEFICRYFKKGDGMLIEGHLEKSTYEARTKSGEAYEKTTVEIVADRVFFAVGTKGRGDGNLHAGSANDAHAKKNGNDTAYVNANGSAVFEEMPIDDNLPF